MPKLLWPVVFAALTLGGCSPQGFFYYPNRILYNDPAQTTYAHEWVDFRSTNGKRLTALWFPAQGQGKGTVVHLHGNFGNLTNHFSQATFLVDAGYNVLSFDYQGYGTSEGRPTPKRLVQDGLSAVHYAVSRSSSLPVALFGQSLGGAVAIVVAAQEPSVRAVVIEAAFAGHGSMARTALGRHLITWPLYPFLPLFMNRSQDARRWVADISPRPILFVHGDRDQIVPVKMSQELYAKAKEPKELWIVPGGRHLGLQRGSTGGYEKRITECLAEGLSSKSAR